MVTFFDSLRNQIRGNFCNFFNTLENGLNFLDLLGGGPALPYAIGAARFGQRLLCNREPEGGTNPPFIGGQCPDVEYDVTVDFTLTDSTGFTIAGPNTVRVLGPVAGVVIVQPVTPGGENMQLRVQARPNTDPSIPFTVVTAASAGAPWEGPFSISNIVRVDGLPDECGDRPPTPTEPSLPSPPILIPVPYDDNDGIPIVIPIVLIYAPIRIDIDGSLVVPFRIQINPDFNVNLNGTLNLGNGNINFNFGSPNYPPSPFPRPDDYDSPDDIPPYPPTVPNSISPTPPVPTLPETKEVIRAVIVTVNTYASDATIIGQDNNPDIYAPNLGFVNFGISSNNAIAWTGDIAVKNFRHFIPCPWEGGAVQVRGTPRPGVTWTLTPVRARVEVPIAFE